MKKATRVVFAVLITIAAVILIAVSALSIYDRVKYSDFYDHASKEFEIPGLWDGVVQQGFDYSAEHGIYIYCGYMMNGGASRAYIIDSDGNSRFEELKEADGSDCTEHVGGISIGGDYVYVTASSRNQIIMYRLSDLLDGDGEAIACDAFDICLSPAYVYVRSGLLYTGEFYREGNYETPESHRLTTPAGDKNTAIIAVYRLGGDGKASDSSLEYIMSTRGLVQGMTMDSRGKVILSTSYGMSGSNLYIYNMDKVKNEQVELDGKQVWVKYLDSSALVGEIIAPPMAEELVYRDGKLMVMTESASMKYIFGKFTSGNHVMSYDYDEVMLPKFEQGAGQTQYPAGGTPKPRK